MSAIGPDPVLRDVDDFLAGRVRRLAEARGWPYESTLLHVIEQGLAACEAAMPALDSDEADALQAALAALQAVPDDPGYALIGRIGGTGQG